MNSCCNKTILLPDMTGEFHSMVCNMLDAFHLGCGIRQHPRSLQRSVGVPYSSENKLQVVEHVRLQSEIVTAISPFNIWTKRKHPYRSILIIVNEMQHKAVYLLFCKFTLHVSGVSHTHHQEYTKL